MEVLRRHQGEPEDLEGSNAVPPAHSEGMVCSPQAFAASHIQSSRSASILLATIPDPLQSADALEFDRDIQALQEAASTAGYDFESIFTGWYLSDLEEPKDFAGGREAQHYRRFFGDEPGAMLFSRAEDGNLLLLLLVPESPTYGLNMHAAEEALSAVNELEKANFSTYSQGISWIGPNYSSSLSGLLRLSSQQNFPFDVFSGSITVGPEIKKLTQLADDRYCRFNPCKEGVPDIQDKATEDDVTALASDTDALHALWKSKLLSGEDGPIVILQENESAYGRQRVEPSTSDRTRHDTGEDSADSNFRIFKFPRGVSHVRGIFGKQLTNFQPQSADAPSTADPESLFDLNDTLQQPLDTAPEFAAQSPFSNEGVLAAIGEGIEHVRPRAIVILATDPLDQLFLARYFHQKLPDVRLVLFTADRLIPNLRSQYDLDGTITVTRRPLFDDSFLRTPKEARHSLTFTNSTQEGVFLAALHQIQSGAIVESAGHRQTEPVPIWIAISSRGAYWPVERVESTSAPATSEHAGPATISYVITDLPEEPLPKLWFLCASCLLLCTWAHFALYLMAAPFNKLLLRSRRAWACNLARHRMLTFYLPCTPDERDPSQWKREFGRRYWLLSATAQLVLLLGYIFLPGISFVAGAQGAPGFVSALHLFLAKTDSFPLLWFGWISLTASIAAVAMLAALIAQLLGQSLSPPKYHRPAATLGYLCWPCMSILWVVTNLVLVQAKLAEQPNGWLFSIRCVHVASGVCPVLPLMLASFSFLIAAAVNLNALALARDRNPGMPSVGLDLIQLSACKKELAAFVECWGLLPNPAFILLLLSVLVALLITQPLRIFGSLDGSGMTWVFTLTFTFGLWTIAWLWVRFFSIWKLLRFLLEALEGSPLRFAFSRLPKVFSLAPIWSYAGLRRTVILPMRWFEYFKVVSHTTGTQVRKDDESTLLHQISLHLFHEQALIDGTYRQFSNDQNEYATELANRTDIQLSWSQGGRDADLSGTANACDDSKSTKEIGGCRPDIPVPCDVDIKDKCGVALGNEYIAMRYGAYIRYVTLQLKNLMTFMSIGLLFLLIAAVSYPFREPQSIAWSLVVIVAILLFGVGTVLIQMDRDSILSRMSETAPGEVDRSAFFWHMLSVGGLPVLTAVSALFPSVGNFLFAWTQPVLTSLH